MELVGAAGGAGVAGPHRVCSISSQNSANRPAASCGPGAASGWYWTLKAGASSIRSPSTTPSLRFTWVTSAEPKSVSKRAGALGLGPAQDAATLPPAGAAPAAADRLGQALPSAVPPPPGIATPKPRLWLAPCTPPA